MAEGESGVSVELRLPFLSIRANNVQTKLRHRSRVAGPFLIISRSSGLALDATTDTAVGTHPVAGNMGAKAHQLWYLRPVGEVSQVHVVSAYSSTGL